MLLIRIARFLAGLLLIPVCAAASMALYGILREIQPGTVPPDAWWLVGGFVFWLFIYVALPRPVRTYILAHELTHALWGWMMGARVSNLKVAEDKGSVTLSKTNFLITLAPYFFPLYTMLTLCLFGVLGLFYAVDRYHLWWMGMVGFTWGFHFTFTVSTLMQHQSDIRSCGYLFSYTFIYGLNVLGIGLWTVAVTPATVERYVTHFKTGLVDSSIVGMDLVTALVEWVR
ncbi:MAG: M50 family metallopeptidase [Kiritimatiellae bacterium]|nr:M50 family metallopeptidase [Kiritimatiellia bacterium]